MHFTPYLAFNGQCADAFKFYEKTFRGKILMMMSFGDSPGCEQTPAEFKNQIMHARLSVGDAILMGSDAPQGHYAKPAGINVALAVTDPAEADRIFNALAEKGTVSMPIQETFWAQRFGMVTDQYDIPWMINCEKPQG